MANTKSTGSRKSQAKPASSASKTSRSSRKVSAKQSVKPAAVTTPSSRTTTKPAVRFKKSYAIIALVIVLLLGVLYVLRSYIVVATVNGQPVYRFAMLSELERQYGKQTLDSMITKSLILQEAKKQNIQISEQQVDAEIKKIESNLKQQGQDLDQVLAMQQLSRDSLRDQVRVQKIVEVLLGREIVITDTDVNDYIASNSASLPTDMPENTLKENVKQQLRQQKLSEKFQTWLQKLRQNAKINYLVTY